MTNKNTQFWVTCLTESPEKRKIESISKLCFKNLACPLVWQYNVTMWI